ncbi:MAG TPA: YlxR family protein [Segeticoccus sp.]|nr:YlxR family protein [Segeticoccus sp.]
MVRTCVGCRHRDDRSALLRVVAVAAGAGDSFVLTPDPHHRLPGRGAWLHPVSACLDRAVRRRAFARALRTGAPVDHAVLARWVESHEQQAR